jgi:hypothetical protein
MRVRILRERVRRIAEAQEGVVSRTQLHACGLSGGDISTWLAQGGLIRILPGVYALGHTRLSWRARVHATLLYAGDEAAVSHATAACLWGLRERDDDRVHVSTSRDKRSIEFVVAHRRRSTFEATDRDGLRLTSPTQTLLDISGVCREPELRKILARADFGGLLEEDSLRSLMGRGKRGSAKLRRTIERHMPELARTLSPLEDRLLLLCERLGLPIPEPNVWVDGMLVDALWARERLVVEVDGHANHSSATQRRRDRERDLQLREAGYLVLRYRWAEIVHEPARVAAEIKAALDMNFAA